MKIHFEDSKIWKHGRIGFKCFNHWPPHQSGGPSDAFDWPVILRRHLANGPDRGLSVGVLCF